MIPALVFGLILLELSVVAWIDLRLKKISNRWIAVNLVLAVAFHLIWKDVYELNWELLIFPAGFIVVGFLLFLVNIMGAGDSKFLASLFLLIPFESHMYFFEKLVLTTLVTGLILFTYRIFRDRIKLKSFIYSGHWKGIREIMKSRFSYAPVVLLAWMLIGTELWN